MISLGAARAAVDALATWKKVAATGAATLAFLTSAVAFWPHVRPWATAGEVAQIQVRQDRLETLILRGQLSAMQGRILDLERQKARTVAEDQYLQSLRDERSQVERQIRQLESGGKP